MKTPIYIFTILFLLGCTKNTSQESKETTVTKKQVTVENTFIDSVVNSIDTRSIQEYSTIVVDGPRDISNVEKEIQRLLISANYWYSRIKPTPTTTAKIVIKLEINDLGVPISTDIIKYQDCPKSILTKLKDDLPQWRFARTPKNKEITTVIYPIFLHPPKHISL